MSEYTIVLPETALVARICGTNDSNLKLIEENLGVTVFCTGNELSIETEDPEIQQKFKFILHDGNKVEAKTQFSMAGYTDIDLGIVKYHFEVGAGKENFKWLP